MLGEEFCREREPRVVSDVIDEPKQPEEGKAAAERRAAELERELAEVSAERDAYRQQAEAQGGDFAEY